MESLPDVAHRILTRHPAAALPFPELHRHVSLEKAGPAPDPDLLLGRIRSDRRRFRVLDPWRGPWRTLLGEGGPEVIATLRALHGVGLTLGPWIVALGPATASPRETATLARLHDSLLVLSRKVDDGSATTLARWILLLREARSAQRRLVGSG